MEISKTLGKGFELLFTALKLVRPLRPIHPDGVILTGSVVPQEHRSLSGIPWIDGFEQADVQARLSRSVGLPVWCPDILGLALRISTGPGCFDVLLASTGAGVPGRFLLMPRRSASAASLTSLMPYEGANGPVILAARTLEPAGNLPAPTQRFREALNGQTWTLGLFFSGPLGSWTRFGTLSLVEDRRNTDDDGHRFDPIINLMPGADNYRWTAELRAPSYARARG